MKDLITALVLTLIVSAAYAQDVNNPYLASVLNPIQSVKKAMIKGFNETGTANKAEVCGAMDLVEIRMNELVKTTRATAEEGSLSLKIANQIEIETAQAMTFCYPEKLQDSSLKIYTFADLSTKLDRIGKLALSLF